MGSGQRASYLKHRVTKEEYKSSIEKVSEIQKGKIYDLVEKGKEKIKRNNKGKKWKKQNEVKNRRI